MENESKQLKNELLKICWYMRGSINIDQAWALGIGDRQLIADVIKGNMENTKKSKLPLI